jgi:hypothetical protein
MSDYLDSLQRRLVDASARLSAERRRRRRRRFAGLGVVVLVAGAPALAATGVWRPAIGNGETAPPRITADSPPADQLALLGVLRRAQSAADRSKPTLEALTFLGSGVDGVRTDSVRLLAAGGADKGIVLVPVERYQMKMPPLPADAPPELKARFAPKRDGLCLMALDRVDGAGVGCFSTQDVRDGRAWQSLGRRGTFIVPDGVARVRVEHRGGVTVEAGVRDNLALYTTPRGLGGWTRVTWLDAMGVPIRTIEAPGAAEERPDGVPSAIGPVAPGSTRDGAVKRVTIAGAGLSARFGIVTAVRTRGHRRHVLLELRLERPACAGKRDVRHKIGSIGGPRGTWSQMLIVSPSTGDFDRARWCAGDYSGEVVADKRTIGTFSFRVTG